ncbi:hypothetical protein INR49_029793, partial [Caranx melampygus]
MSAFLHLPPGDTKLKCNDENYKFFLQSADFGLICHYFALSTGDLLILLFNDELKRLIAALLWNLEDSSHQAEPQIILNLLHILEGTS